MTAGLNMRWHPGTDRCWLCRVKVTATAEDIPAGKMLGIWQRGPDYKALCRSCGGEYERRMRPRDE